MTTTKTNLFDALDLSDTDGITDGELNEIKRFLDRVRTAAGGVAKHMDFTSTKASLEAIYVVVRHLAGLATAEQVQNLAVQYISGVGPKPEPLVLTAPTGSSMPHVDDDATIIKANVADAANHLGMTVVEFIGTINLLVRTIPSRMGVDKVRRDQRLAELLQVAEHGLPNPKDDPAVKAELQKEKDAVSVANAKLAELAKALGIDLTKVDAKDIAGEVGKVIDAAKATVTATIDDATKNALRKEGADGVIADVKPFIEKVIGSWSHVVARGDKDKQLGVILAADGLDESIRNAAKSAVGL